jgi:hypothetical protein
MSEMPDYEVEIEVTGARFPVFGYAPVRGTSTQEALDQVVEFINQGVGVFWRDRQDNRVRWEDFFLPGMDVQIADITPYGSKWSLRRYAEGQGANPGTSE